MSIKKISFISAFCVVILACSACSTDTNSNPESTTATARIELTDTSTTVGVEEQPVEPYPFIEVPSFSNLVFNLLEQPVQDSGNYITDSTENTSISTTPAWSADDVGVDINADVQFSDMDWVLGFSSDNVGILYSNSRRIKYDIVLQPIQQESENSDDLKMNYMQEEQPVSIFNLNFNMQDHAVEFYTSGGNLYMTGDLFGYSTQYRLEPQWDLNYEKLQQKMMSDEEARHLNFDKLMAMYTEADAPQVLIDYLNTMHSPGLSLDFTTKVKSGTVKSEYRIKDQQHALITIDFNGSVGKTLINDYGGFYDIDCNSKIATFYSLPMTDLQDLISEWQCGFAKNPSEISISSDTATYNDVEYTRVHVIDNNNFDTYYYFDMQSGVIKYIVTKDSVIMVSAISANTEMDDSMFNLPADYKVIK